MSNLTRHKFANLYQLASGISSKPEQAGHGAPFLSFSAVFNNYFLPNELTDRMDTSEQEQKKYSIYEGDIFLTRTSEVIDELGMSSVALKNYQQATYSGFLKRLRPIQEKVTYPKFMAFYLRSSLFRKTMTNNAVLTLRASLNEDIFSYLELILPEYGDQVKAGDFLYLLSQKIDCNNRINAELEAMAKTLYDYWFVQFDFPDANGKPYKSSGGKMVYNTTLKRDIPAGWEAATLSQFIEFERGVTYGKEDVCTSDTQDSIGILRATNVTGNVVDVNDLVFVPASKVSSAQVLKKYETLIVMSSGSKEHVGKNGIYYFDEPRGFGAFCSKLTASANHRFFVNTFLQSPWFKAHIKNSCLGTNINNLTNDHINECLIVKPDVITAQLFEDKVSVCYEKISNNASENQHLTQLRDWLLPMLMNGQVTVA